MTGLLAMLAPRMTRVAVVAALGLAACGSEERRLDAGTPVFDAEPNAPLDAETGFAPDAPSPECGPFETLENNVCVDVDECLTDNGGCGEREAYTCFNEDRALPTCRFDPSSDWAFLTQDVRTIDSAGALPSSMVVHGPTAFGVIFDEGDRPFVAAARHEAGRVVVFGHEAYLGELIDNESDVDQLLANAIGWTTRGTAPVVGMLQGFDRLERYVESLGHSARPITLDALDEVNLLVLLAQADRSEADWDRIREWVAGGGGLLVGGLAWWWSYSNENTATAFPGNQLLNPLGITYTPFTDVTAGQDTVLTTPPGPLRHARDALIALSDLVEGRAQLSSDAVRLGAETAGLAAGVLPIEPFKSWFAQAVALERVIGPVVINDARWPLVRAIRPLDALAITIANKMALEAPVESVAAVPMAAVFPGAVDQEEDPVTRELTVDGTYEGLSEMYLASQAESPAIRSTGLYAPPGQIVTVSIPPSAIGRGLGVQIGAHTDTLQHKLEWARYPYMVRQEPLNAPTVRTASGLGGPLYITVPAGSDLGDLTITVEGGVEMPYFKRGVTTTEQWTALRQRGAPWAELASDKLILTVPSASIRTLEDPEPLLALWDRVLQANEDLSGFSRARPRAERFVFDRQISAGWMHSGYPIMAHLESVPEALNLTSPSSKGSWGLFHELGHNHQWRDWMLPGSGEGNVNLFTVHAMEEVMGVDRADAIRELIPERRRIAIANYLATGPDFARWTVWTSLETYLQVQEAFGWAPLTQVFTEYRNLSAAQRPTNDAERINQWAVRLSEAVGRDLSGFLRAWGHPLSLEAIEAVSHLPPWTDHPVASP